MRLLDTATGEFRWVQDPRRVRFAILSHVWPKEGDVGYVPEQTFQDVCAIQESVPRGELALPHLSRKIRHFCEVARNDGFELGWIDSACIDKTSSSELSEAINSMYNWYRYAGACYAILQDVNDAADEKEQREQFRSSKWFTRGWTLQELLAPSVVLFLSDKWRIIGSKHTLAPLIESVTGIECTVLTLERPLEDVSVACRMSWAASRETSRKEDEAYSIMGIFGVNMPTTYGEGRYAFVRLQEEILKHIPDQTIFAWGPLLKHHNFTFSNPSHPSTESISEPPLPTPPSLKQYLLAQAPSDFKTTAHLVPLSREAFAYRLGISPEAAYQIYTMTSYGIHARVPLVSIVSQDANANIPTHLALLACEDAQGRMLALLLRPQEQASGTQYLVGTIVGRVKELIQGDGQYPILWSHYSRATYLTLKQVYHCVTRGHFVLDDVYIPHRPTHAASGLERDASIHTALCEARDAFEVRLAGWSRKLLLLQGFRVSPGGDVDVALRDRVLSRTLSPSTSGIVLSNAMEYISIQVGRCSCEFGSRFGLLGVLISSRNAVCALEEQFADQQHFINHPVHIHSWGLRCGIASKEVVLESSSGIVLTLRLTFTSEAADTSPRVRSYRLGVEVWATPASNSSQGPSRVLDGSVEPRVPQQGENGSNMYLAPTGPLPLQRSRSNSAPYVAGSWPLDEDDSDSLEDVPAVAAQQSLTRRQRHCDSLPTFQPIAQSDMSGHSSGGHASAHPNQIPPWSRSRDVNSHRPFHPPANWRRRSRSVDLLVASRARGYDTAESDYETVPRPRSVDGQYVARRRNGYAFPAQVVFGAEEAGDHESPRKGASPLRKSTVARAYPGRGLANPAISSNCLARDRVPQVLRESPVPMSSSEPDELEPDMVHPGRVTANPNGTNASRHDARTYHPRACGSSRIPVPKPRSATMGRTAFEAERSGSVAKRSRGTSNGMLPVRQGYKDTPVGVVTNGVSLPIMDKSQAERLHGGAESGPSSVSGIATTAQTQLPGPSGSKDETHHQRSGATGSVAGHASEKGRPVRDQNASDVPDKRGLDNTPARAVIASSSSVCSPPQSEPLRPLAGAGIESSRPQSSANGEKKRKGWLLSHLPSIVCRHPSHT